MDDIAISFDIDWAPDFAITTVCDMLVQNGVKATWFVTHDSDGVRRLFEHADLFEIGVHPNFMPDSSQGSGHQDVMRHVMRIVPGAQTVRTHAMFYSAPLSKMFALEFGLKYDSSIFLSRMANIAPHEICYESATLIRLPYFWSDDGEMSIMKSPSFAFDARYRAPGLKILDFHPIHVFLNSGSMDNYNALKSSAAIRSCTAKEAKPFVHEGRGSASLLRDIIMAKPNPKGFRTISELAEEWAASAAEA
jgi:hypothetical protein